MGLGFRVWGLGFRVFVHLGRLGLSGLRVRLLSFFFLRGFRLQGFRVFGRLGVL